MSCTTYTVRLRDNDNDGIFDIIDADIDNDGSIDPGKTDVNNDGMIDEANDPNYSFGTVSYQRMSYSNNILRGNSRKWYLQVVIPNTKPRRQTDHDGDPDRQYNMNIWGTASCSADLTKIDRLKGSSLASNLMKEYIV